MNKESHKKEAGLLDSISPVSPNNRPMTKLNYALVFWSSGIIVQVMVIGQYLLYPTGGLNFIQVLIAGFIAAVGIAFFMTLQGHAGMRYGIPFIVQGRSCFGTNGTKIVAILRCIPAIAWNGIGTWIGALALEQVTNSLFGFSSLWAYFFGLIILQSLLAYRGIETISKFNGSMSFIIFAMLLYFFYVVFTTGDIDFTAASQVEGSWGWAWVAGMMAAFANFTTVVLNASDITRQVNPKGKSILKTSAIANFVGVLPPWMFMIVSGMLIGLATGSKDPIAGLVELSPTPLFGIILLIFIVLAQITSNLTLNILPPALAFQDIMKTSWKGGIIWVAILSVISAPWVLLSSDYFFKFQNIYSSFLGPATAIMIADYFIIRKMNLNVKKLYNDKEYNYRGGFSFVGMVSLVAGAVASFIFLDYSWFVGFPFTFILFLFLKYLGADEIVNNKALKRVTE